MLLLLVALLAVTLLAGLSLLLLRSVYSDQMTRLEKLLIQEREDHRKTQDRWEVERERLLNRAMVKEWTTYAQMTTAMSSASISEADGRGLSDAEEMRRAGFTDGIGEEVALDMRDELHELGIS